MIDLVIFTLILMICPIIAHERERGLKLKKLLEAKPRGVGKVRRGESESGGPTPARVPWEKPS